MAELMKPASPTTSNNDWQLQMMGTDVNYTAMISICEQLAAWPAERAEVVRVAQTDFHGQLDGTTDSSRFRVQAELPLLRAVMNAGDHGTAQQVLRDIDITMKKVDDNAPNAWPRGPDTGSECDDCGGNVRGCCRNPGRLGKRGAGDE